MRNPLRLFPSSPFAGDLSSKCPSHFKRGSMFLGNSPISEVVPAFALLPESSRRRSSRPDNRTMEHSQVSTALLSFASLHGRPLHGPCHHHRARHSARNGPVVADLSSDLQLPSRRDQAREHANFINHHKFCLLSHLFPKCVPNGTQKDTKWIPNAHLLLPNGIQMRRKWSPNGTQMDTK